MGHLPDNGLTPLGQVATTIQTDCSRAMFGVVPEKTIWMCSPSVLFQRITRFLQEADDLFNFSATAPNWQELDETESPGSTGHTKYSFSTSHMLLAPEEK